MVYPSISPLERILPQTMRALSEVIHDIAPRFGWSGDALGMLEANPELAVAIAAGEIWSTTSMAKWIYKKGKSFVTPNKKRKSKAPASQLPAQRMPKRPRPADPFDISGRMPKRGRTGRSGAVPRYSMKSGKRVKRASKPLKVSGRYVKRHYDDAGFILKNFCGWAGFQDHGSQNRMWSSIGEALTKAMFATQKIYFLSYDERVKPGISSTSPIAYEYRYLKLKFKRLNMNGVSEPLNQSIELFDPTAAAGKTFGQISEEVSNLCRLNSDVADAGTTVAYYPYSFTWGATAADNIEDGTTHYDLGEAMVDVYCNQVITLQNQTLDDGLGDQTTAIDANPVKVKAYHFNHKFPRLIDRVQETLRVDNTTIDNFMYDAPIRANGINTAVTMENEDSSMAHAPPAKEWSTNCTGIQNFKMAPGKSRTVKTTFKIRSSIKLLVERLHLSGYSKGTFGKSTWFAIQHEHKTPAHTQIRVPFTRTCRMGAHVQLKRTKAMLSHYEFNEHT